MMYRQIMQNCDREEMTNWIPFLSLAFFLYLTNSSNKVTDYGEWVKARRMTSDGGVVRRSCMADPRRSRVNSPVDGSGGGLVDPSLASSSAPAPLSPPLPSPTASFAASVSASFSGTHPLAPSGTAQVG